MSWVFSTGKITCLAVFSGTAFNRWVEQIRVRKKGFILNICWERKNREPKQSSREKKLLCTYPPNIVALLDHGWYSALAVIIVWGCDKFTI
jgi:hypothetical protein